MDTNTIIQVIQKALILSQKDYDRNLNRYGEDSSITNFHKGKMVVYKSLLEFLKANERAK